MIVKLAGRVVDKTIRSPSASNVFSAKIALFGRPATVKAAWSEEFKSSTRSSVPVLVAVAASMTLLPAVISLAALETSPALPEI